MSSRAVVSADCWRVRFVEVDPLDLARGADRDLNQAVKASRGGPA
jgi:hypothetical protein